MKKKERGITLIALVVTIVVLLILAGVSISMLTGENGIIKQAQNSKDATEQARVEELVDLAVSSLIGENLGSTNGITPEMVAEEVNEMESRDDVYAEGSTFPTNIIFPEEDRKVEVDLSQKEDLEEIYTGDVDEKDIAPMDLFEYEIIDNAETGALTLSELPTKRARITGIKQEYCNGGGIQDVEDTNYEIIYKGTKISDTLVVPYKVELDGEMYVITEVQLLAYGEKNDETGNDSGYLFPRVETVIYPNTVEKIYGKRALSSNPELLGNATLKTVILSNKLKTIGEYTFYACEELTNMTIPDSVTSIENDAFAHTAWEDNLPDGEIYLGKCYYKYKGEMPEGTNIKIKEGTTSICAGAFVWCEGLTGITIPNTVTSIGNQAFEYCTGLANITIPESVTSMGSDVFEYWESTQTINEPFKEGEEPAGWSDGWNYRCYATINYQK